MPPRSSLFRRSRRTREERRPVPHGTRRSPVPSPSMRYSNASPLSSRYLYSMPSRGATVNVTVSSLNSRSCGATVTWPAPAADAAASASTCRPVTPSSSSPNRAPVPTGSMPYSAGRTNITRIKPAASNAAPAATAILSLASNVCSCSGVGVIASKSSSRRVGNRRAESRSPSPRRSSQTHAEGSRSACASKSTR